MEKKMTKDKIKTLSSSDSLNVTIHLTIKHKNHNIELTLNKHQFNPKTLAKELSTFIASITE